MTGVPNGLRAALVALKVLWPELAAIIGGDGQTMSDPRRFLPCFPIANPRLPEISPWT